MKSLWTHGEIVSDKDDLESVTWINTGIVKIEKLHIVYLNYSYQNHHTIKIDNRAGRSLGHSLRIIAQLLPTPPPAVELNSKLVIFPVSLIVHSAWCYYIWGRLGLGVVDGWGWGWGCGVWGVSASIKREGLQRDPVAPYLQSYSQVTCSSCFNSISEYITSVWRVICKIGKRSWNILINIRKNSPFKWWAIFM